MTVAFRMPYTGWFQGDFENISFPSMHAETPRTVVNYATCEFCEQPFQPDSSGSKICSRPICTEVRMIRQRRKHRV